MTHRWPDAANLLALLAQATGPGTEEINSGRLDDVAEITIRFAPFLRIRPA